MSDLKHMDDVLVRAIDQITETYLPAGNTLSINKIQGGIQTIFELGLNSLTARAVDLGCSQEQIAHAIAVGREQYAKGHDLCESPIERMMLAALITAKWPQFLSLPPLVHDGRRDRIVPAGDLIIVPQMAFMRYRLDFGLLVEWNDARHLIAIECDGGQFHRNRFADLARDLYLASWGIPVFRLRGSDIHSDVEAVIQPLIYKICLWRSESLTDLSLVAREFLRSRA